MDPPLGLTSDRGGTGWSQIDRAPLQVAVFHRQLRILPRTEHDVAGVGAAQIVLEKENQNYM